MRQKKNLGKYDRRLTEKEELLNEYLNQYQKCINRKRALERRKEEIIKEFEDPLTGMGLDGMPKGSSSGIGCAAISFRLDAIEIQIKDQIEKTTKTLTDVMTVIDCMPQDALERSIIENKYIDRAGWKRICKENNVSRSPATRYWKKGLHDLIELEKVEKILQEYQEAKEDGI